MRRLPTLQKGGWSKEDLTKVLFGMKKSVP
jgi:hypothetical protein